MIKCKEKRKSSYQKRYGGYKTFAIKEIISTKGRVQRTEQGQILLSRRKEKQDFQVDDYGPFPNCLEWVSLDLIILYPHYLLSTLS